MSLRLAKFPQTEINHYDGLCAISFVFFRPSSVLNNAPCEIVQNNTSNLNLIWIIKPVSLTPITKSLHSSDKWYVMRCVHVNIFIQKYFNIYWSLTHHFDPTLFSCHGMISQVLSGIRSSIGCFKYVILSKRLQDHWNTLDNGWVVDCYYYATLSIIKKKLDWSAEL